MPTEWDGPTVGALAAMPVGEAEAVVVVDAADVGVEAAVVPLAVPVA